MQEEKQIKGEVEAWSQVRDLGSFSSRGVKIEGSWYNATGTSDGLEKLDEEHPKGSYVSFNIKQNKKGYWNISSEIKGIEKEDAYQEPPIQEEKQPIEEETITNIKLNGQAFGMLMNNTIRILIDQGKGAAQDFEELFDMVFDRLLKIEQKKRKEYNVQ